MKDETLAEIHDDDPDWMVTLQEELDGMKKRTTPKAKAIDFVR